MSDNTNQPTPSPDWDPWGPAEKAEPFAAQADLRGRCPIAYSDRMNGFWSITKYDDVAKAATDSDHFKNGLRPKYTIPSPPLESDPPEHTYFRKLLMPFFTPARMKVMDTQIRAFTVELLEPLIDTGGGDFAQDFAFLLPVRAFCFLLNLPDQDWPLIKDWSRDAYSVYASMPELRERYEIANNAIYSYARQVLAERRAAPRNPDDDLISALVSARHQDTPLSDDTIIGIIRLLLTAGHESTASSIGNCILYLARNPAAQAELRANPKQILPAAEEILRWESPIMAMPRVVASPVELGGHQFSAGDYVYLLFASANRDEARFPNADQCLFDRRPNPHMVFGWGKHNCIGAPLARVEIASALEELLARTEHFALAGEVERTIFHRRGVLNLPLTVTPAS